LFLYFLPFYVYTHIVRWFEQDPCKLVESVWECLEKVGEGLQAEVARLKGIGITNQRETTILWDRTTGKPLHNAIGEEPTAETVA